MEVGKVTLVGAGPSGLDLLTLRGFNALQNADVVVFDRLVEQDIIDIIPDKAEKIDVGKQNNHHPVPQEQINQILVGKAKENKNVVRLKGGDCFLFGRGGEECEYLLANNIPFEVVSGVTSAIAAPAYAGIPVTHRDFCSSVHIITAHAKAGKKLEIDFESLVKLKGTLVFLMGLSSINEVMQGLINSGMSKDMPAAVIENGTRLTQRKIVSDISNISQKVKDLNFKSPSIIVVGEVCTLSDSLDWFSKQPLYGQTVVVTRPKERIGTLSEKLRRLGANVIECPCIQTVNEVDTDKFNDALKKQYDYVVLTSPAGVSAMIEALEKINKDLRVFYNCKFAVIGSGTAKELKKYGINADLMPEIYDSEHLGKLLADKLNSNSSVLILRAKGGSKELTTTLERKGINFSDISTYITEYCCNKSEMLREIIENGVVNVITFTSSSTVTGFVNSINLDKYNNFTALCIGKQTAKKAEFYGMKTKIAKNATIDSMIAALLEENHHV
ncbi:MAG TPA: uroporphyrinogen-III C-methyltransferase [Candidatus Butyricicoccus avistercoris]|uniref:uroporphyrinogen-III C-methyltransferase n=1 Tax=Candidatus Butyricicoccus avistercoris TaxID=2838518 RepID=A0A9D1PK64_9FIRM|nr:uroporphyrinogen-III C-methyltransferase [Candidatus Butyricicoccus avistercoris]